ncbi:hypothetical protein M758_8G108600 [Ceratodon purpureus]|nr:hypothetical protein M758_8G108600 [Ceratodon purpureus]
MAITSLAMAALAPLPTFSSSSSSSCACSSASSAPTCSISPRGSLSIQLPLGSSLRLQRWSGLRLGFGQLGSRPFRTGAAGLSGTSGGSGASGALRVFAEMSTLDEATILELPCLPFSPAEVFIPTSSKTLHLYEARFLSLLEEVMAKGNNLLAHIVIEPVKGGEGGVASFVATYGCLARIESVKQLEIGALVSIRGLGRIKMVNLTQMEPFIKSTVMPVRDEYPEERDSLPVKIESLKKTLAEVQQLQIKIKTAKEVPLLTPLEKALQWADKGESDPVVERFVPSREERLSFAALQPIAGASPGELHKLLQERLKAMTTVDTEVRLNNAMDYAEQSRASVAAKVALQSLQLG